MKHIFLFIALASSCLAQNMIDVPAVAAPGKPQAGYMRLIYRDGGIKTIDPNGLISEVGGGASLDGSNITDPAAWRESIGAAPSSLQLPQELEPLTILVHDDMSGPEASLAINAARTAHPGPGVVEMRSSDGANSRVYYENNEALIATMPNSGGSQTVVHWMPASLTGITAAPGLCLEVRLVPNVKLGVDRSAKVGFSELNTHNYTGSPVLIVSSTSTAAPGVSVAKMAATNDYGSYPFRNMTFLDNEEIGLRVWIKSLNDVRYAIQCKAVANVGCGLGQNWYPVGNNIPTPQVFNRGQSGIVTSNGTLVYTLTAANLVGSPKAYNVPVTIAAHNTQLKVAQAVADVLNADAAFNANWIAEAHIMHTKGNVHIRATTARADDATLNLVLPPGLGITSETGSGGLVAVAGGAGHAGQVSGIADAPTLWPYVATQFRDGVQVRDVKVYANYRSNGRTESFTHVRGMGGIHVPSLETDPVSGLLMISYNVCTAHVGTDGTQYAAVRLPDGTWTEPVSLLSRPMTFARQNCALFQWQGKLWWSYFDMWENGETVREGGTLYRREVTIDPVTGAISIGDDEINCNIPSSYGLFFSKPKFLPSGRAVWAWHQDDGGGSVRAYVAYSDDNMDSWSEPVLIHVSKWLAEPDLILESDGSIGMWLRANTTSGGCAHYSRSTDDGVTWSAPVLVKNIPQPATSGARMQVLKKTDGSMWLIGNNEATTVSRANLTIWRIGDNGTVLDNGTELLDPLVIGGSYVQYPVLHEDGDRLLIAYSHEASAGLSANTGIFYHELLWPDSVIGTGAGGTGSRRVDYRPSTRKFPMMAKLTAAATVTPDMRIGRKDGGEGASFDLLMTSSITTMNVPINPLPNEEIEILITQQGSGSYTIGWHANWEFNAITPTLQTAVNRSNSIKARYNPFSNKWIVTDFN
jgi:hypothetical protein